MALHRTIKKTFSYIANFLEAGISPQTQTKQDFQGYCRFTVADSLKEFLRILHKKPLLDMSKR